MERRLTFEGQRLGKYLLVDRIGSGGMAEVYLARHEGVAGFAKDLVIKMILPGLVDDSRFVDMFLNEARLAARLDHPNVVQIFDFGYEASRYFLAMEYVRGLTLRKVRSLAAKQEAPVPPRILARVACGVCEGLHHAHESVDNNGKPLEIIHRDVSPDNVIVSRSGIPKVLDFGIAKASVAVATTQGTLKGKYNYMAPELIKGEEIDQRVDVYAVGVVLYELVTGRRPFPGSESQLLELLESIVAGAPPPPRELRPDLPEAFEQIILRAMAKNPGKRYQSAHDLRVALESFISGSGEAVLEADVSRYLEELVAGGDSSNLFARALATPTSARRPAPAGSGPEAQRPGSDFELPPDQELATIASQVDVTTPEPPPAAAGAMAAVRVEPGGPKRRVLVAAAALLAAAAVGVGAAIWLDPLGSQQEARSRSGVETEERARGEEAEGEGVGDEPLGEGEEAEGEMAAGVGGPEGAAKEAGEVIEAEGHEAEGEGGEGEDVEGEDVEGEELAREGGKGEEAGGALVRDEAQRRGRQKSRGGRDQRRERRQGGGARGGVATLTVHSHPWCTVYLDGDKLGSTPLNGVEVPAGRHRLGCVNDGKGIKLSKRISLEVGGRASETFRFGRGKVQVRVKPWGAVWIDGDKKGITPLGAITLFEGMHRVRVVNEDLGESRTLHVRVEAGRTKTVRVNLTD